MTVTPYEDFRFKVSSETTRGKKYLVDICGPDGFPCCDCEHFRVRIQPKLAVGIRATEKYCKHLDAVVIFLGQRVVEQMRTNQPPKE